MTRTVRPEEEVQMLKPEYVAPLIAALCSEGPPANGQLYEAGSGYFAATRWQRTRGVDFEHAKGVPSVEEVFKVSSNTICERGELTVVQAFPEICNFDNGQADNPDTPQDGSRYTMGNVLKNPKIVSYEFLALDVQQLIRFLQLRPEPCPKRIEQIGNTSLR